MNKEQIDFTRRDADLVEMEREARMMPPKEKKDWGIYEPYDPAEVSCKQRSVVEGQYICNKLGIKPDDELYCCMLCQFREGL